jgi:acetyl esterase/lipase
MKKHLFVLFFLFFFMFSCKKHSDPGSDISYTERVVELDYAYGSHTQQTMDIFIPEGNRDTMALVVMVHGGGWTQGDKSSFSQWFEYEKNRNRYAVININYRLDNVQTRPLPMQTDDIHAAIEKIRNEFRLPARKIGLIGGSAGAHLVSQYAYKYDTQGFVKAVVNFVGPVDFNDPQYHTPGHWEYIFSGIEYIFNLAYSGNENQYADWSPYHHVSAQSPPTALFYGQLDSLVPYTQGERLHAKLNAYSVENEYYLYPDSGHGFNSQDSEDAAIKAGNFLDRHL